MLTRLSIENFATVDSLDMQLGSGLTVLTGETGAGKSILFDALDLLFGARAESIVVRTGAARCQLEAEVSLQGEAAALEWLSRHELTDEDDPECLLLRRVIRADGGSKAWINGQQSTLAMLRELAEVVLDIHGQHAHQALLRAAEQRRIIDDFGGHTAALEATRQSYADWRRAEQELAKLGSAALNDPAQRELLEYQCSELNEFAPQDGEFAALNTEFLRLNRIDELQSDCAWLESKLGGEDAIEDQLGEAGRRCEKLVEAQPDLGAALEALTQARDAVVEARREIQHAADGFENDPERLAEVSSRLDQWESLARKHRCPAEELASHAAQLNDQLGAAAGDDQRRIELEKQIQGLAQTYATAAMALTAERKQAAGKLAKAVMHDLPSLGLPHARIEFALNTNSETASADGQDAVQIQVSLNPGQSLQSLAKVASGGELARISLAIAVNAHASRRVPILLFDEVDVGVGGAIATAIGEHLLTLAATNQVLCVTHQPQVAALGKQHYRVQKDVANEQTFSRLILLDHSARVDEISRMAGGREITAQTRAHAEALLGLSDSEGAKA